MNGLRIGYRLSGIIVLLALTSCAPRTYLMVDYRLPASPQGLQGRQVRIEIRDIRSDRQIFTPAAARQFEYFNNRYDLVVMEGKQNLPLGPEDLQGLFRTAFKRRLEQLGARIAPSEGGNATIFQILIQEIRIDLQDHEWSATIRYEADLVQDKRLVASETVSGSAQRTRIVGSKGADKALSDIFTDAINRLDIVKLFQRAKLV
jgi:hypothetical protein